MLNYPELSLFLLLPVYGAVITDYTHGESLTREILQLMHDLSSCSEELENLVSESSVLSIPVDDILSKFRYLEELTRNEIEVYRNAKQNISQSFPSGQIDSTLTNESQPDIEHFRHVISAVNIPTSAPTHGICLENTWARSYLTGNESRHPGLTWKRGPWQKLRKPRPGQLGRWLGSFDACAAYGRRWDEICYITGMTVIDDETVVVSDNENFLIRIFNINGDPLREFHFEPLLLGELTRLPGPKKRILVDVKLLNNKDATLFVDLDDGSSKLVNKSEFDFGSRDSSVNCTIADDRAYEGMRFEKLNYQRADGTIFVAGYGGDDYDYDRKLILQYDSNCSFIGITTRTRYNIEKIEGFADLLVVNLDTNSRLFSRDRVAVFHIP